MLIHLHIIHGAFVPQYKVAAKFEFHTKIKIVIIWSFTEKVCYSVTCSGLQTTECDYKSSTLL
jgi:hypothetical protein